MSHGPLCPNLSKKVQKEVSQMTNCNLSCAMLYGGLSVNLNHLKRGDEKQVIPQKRPQSVRVKLAIKIKINQKQEPLWKWIVIQKA